MAAILARLGATVVDADVISRQLMQPGTAMLAQVVDRWGSGVLNPDGSLNRKRLGELVFGDAQATAELNRITHGAIMAQLRAEVEAAPTPVVVAVIPLLLETGAEGTVDEVWVVSAPVETQLERMRGRDGLDEAEGRKRLARQWTLEQRLSKADVVIPNAGTPEALEAAVRAAWDSLQGRVGRNA